MSDSDMLSQGEVESPLKAAPDRDVDDEVEQSSNPNPNPSPSANANANGVSSLGRQSSIYSLTLDEFQSTMGEGGKNFGSMNMDEFLNSIWTAEEHQAQAAGAAPTPTPTQQSQTSSSANQTHQEASDSAEKGTAIVRQNSLARQASLNLTGPLSRKTVEEVWDEIHRGQQAAAAARGVEAPPQTPVAQAERQATFGEMTLEDFLVKAGVVREQCQPPPPPPMTPQTPYPGFYPNGGFVGRPVLGLGGVGVGSFPVIQQQPVYGPVSPVSSDGMCGNPIGMDMAGNTRRKRVIDGPVEKVVERRQRRMIKNRESAARSRARKQAYTVELEAELHQMKEENACLRRALAESARRMDPEDDVAECRGGKRIRRTVSCFY